MSSKGIVVGYIHFSKLSQRSAQNQVDYTCKSVYFFFFLVGIHCGWESAAASEKPWRVPRMKHLYNLYLIRISVRTYRATEIQYLTLQCETELDEHLIVLIEMLLFYKWLSDQWWLLSPSLTPLFPSPLCIPDEEKSFLKQSQESGT